MNNYTPKPLDTSDVEAGAFQISYPRVVDNPYFGIVTSVLRIVHGQKQDYS